MSEQTTLPPARVVQLTEKLFVVSIKSAPGTHWLVDDAVFLKGLTVHCRTTAAFSTTGMIPLVDVRLEKSNTSVDGLLATVKERGAS